MRSALILLTALGLGTSASTQDRVPERTLAVRAARILTMAGDPIDGGVMVVSGGKIVAIGPAGSVTIPADAEVLDFGEKVLCPGYVDLHHHVSSGGGDINDMVHPINAELRTLDVVRPSAEIIRRTLSGGVTTTLFIPGSGTNIGGFGVLLKMRWGSPLEEMVIQELGAMKVAQGYNPERRSGDMGATRMGMRENLTHALEQGRDYAAAWRAFDQGKGPKPKFDPSLEQLRKVFDLEVPVIVHTAGARDCIATARMFQSVFPVRLILSHGTFNGWWAAAEIAKRKIPVNLGPRTYQFTEHGRFQGIAAGYWNYGCRDISINTDAPVISPDQLMLQAAMAVRLGLPYEVALRGLTITPARQIGHGDRIGSLEPGKDADFLVLAGDPLDPRNPPERVFIEGQLVYRLGDIK